MVMVTREQDKRIRSIARGVLQRNKEILLIQVRDKKGTWWILPGGGQEFGESLASCLIRECEEELGAGVEVGQCLLVREFVGANRSRVVGNVSNKHFLEVYFQISTGHSIDLKPREPSHLSIEWVPIDRLHHIAFFPKVLIDRLQHPSDNKSLYVGDAD